MNLHKIYPVVLLYHEDGMTRRTEDALRASGFAAWAWGYADRDGVGSMSKAFNRAVDPVSLRNYEFVWFLTNVTFPPEMPASLLDAMNSGQRVAAVHPAFDSDHPHIRDTKDVADAPFVEWTAPLIRIEALMDVGTLDERMPYVHFDLDWSHRARLNGWTLLVDGRHRLAHTYLWKDAPERISVIRRELRSIAHPASVQAMKEKWGNNWSTKLCPTGTCG